MWLLLVVVPIRVALFAILPDLLENEAPLSVEQIAENLEQTTAQGHNIMNVQGNITITDTPPKDEKKP